MCQQIRSSLTQVIASRLIGAKPLLTYRELDHRRGTDVSGPGTTIRTFPLKAPPECVIYKVTLFGFQRINCLVHQTRSDGDLTMGSLGGVLRQFGPMEVTALHPCRVVSLLDVKYSTLEEGERKHGVVVRNVGGSNRFIFGWNIFKYV